MRKEKSARGGKTTPNFVLLAAHGRILRSELFFLKIVRNHFLRNRYAIIVSGKTLKSAVARNLARRRFKSLFREWERSKHMHQGFDIAVTITKKEIIKLPFGGLRKTCEELLRKATLL